MKVIRNGVEYTLRAYDVAILLEYSVSHVLFLARKNKIPSIRRGKIYLFNREQVEQALLTGEPPTQPAEKQESVDYESEESLDDIIYGI